MTQILVTQKLITVREFLELKPDANHYELHNGVIVEMSQPKGKHEQVTGFLTVQIGTESARLKLPYFIPKTALVKSFQNDSCFSPDVLLVNTDNLNNEELWSDYSTLQFGESIPLVIEVVSTNWQDDYYMKLGEYETIKIIEYWIVDYAALGARKFIGNPKQPTVSIYSLVDGEYLVTQFRGDDRILSPTFPNLNLTANQIFNASL
jgi:Uma2 family endonuclease